jgi:hypothetical protein
MNHEDRDLDQLKEFRTELAQPQSDRLARIRAKIVHNAGSAPPTGRFVNRKFLVPGIAAASVLVVAVGAGIIAFNNNESGTAGIGSSPTTKSSAPDQPVPPKPGEAPAAEKPGVAPNSEGPMPEKTRSTPVPPSAAEHQKAVSLLEQFATGGPEPLAVPQGKLLYVRGESKKSPTMVHELWLDVNGSIPVMIRRADEGQGGFTVPDPNNPKDNHDEQVVQQRAELATKGPDLRLTTPVFLAGLPTDPDALFEQFRKIAVESGGPWSADHAIVDFARGFLYNNEPLLSPQVRSAFYRMLAKVDSISSTGELIELDGRKLYAIGQSEREGRQELLIDAQTGRFVGSRTGDFYDLWSYAVVSKAGATS